MTKTILLGLLGLTTFTSAAPVSLTRRGTGKRGLVFAKGSDGLTNYFSNGSQVSWMYDWEATVNHGSSGLEYVPMLHSNENTFTSVWEQNVKAANPTHVLGFNEPDQCGGGGICITDPATAASAHKEHMSFIESDYPGVKIGAPAVTNGVKSEAGTDMGLPYLKLFLEACSDCRIDFVAAHWHNIADNAADFKTHMKDVHDQTGKPVWVTEFSLDGSEAQQQAFLEDVLPWMDSQNWIERYAYHYVAPGVLINSAGTGLSALGNTYQSA